MRCVRALLATAPVALAALLLLRGIAPQWASLAALAGGGVALLAFPTPVSRLVRGETTALTTALEVDLIILGGLFLYEVGRRAGAHEALGRWFGGLSTDPVRSALVMVLGVTPFVESMTGLGVGAIFAFPLLLVLGFPPRRAAFLALLGFVTVPWGGLAVGTQVAARLTGLSFQSVGVASAVISLPVYLVVGAVAMLVAAGFRDAPRRLPELMVLSVSLWVGIWLANAFLGTSLAGAVGSLLAIAVGLLLIRVRERRPLPPVGVELVRGALPYGLLLGLLTASRVLSSSLRLGGTATLILTSAATWLMVASVLSGVVLRLPPSGILGALRDAATRWWRVALTTLAFLCLGGLMVAAGMSAALASAAVSLGRPYVLFAPLVGGVGGFLTGSNSGANAMFAAAQAQAAQRLRYPVLWLVAGQNVSASVATMASGPRLQLAMSLLGTEDRDPTLFRRVLAVDTLALVPLSVLLLVI
jgi:lactate permease